MWKGLHMGKRLTLAWRGGDDDNPCPTFCHWVSWIIWVGFDNIKHLSWDSKSEKAESISVQKFKINCCTHVYVVVTCWTSSTWLMLLLDWNFIYGNFERKPLWNKESLWRENTVNESRYHFPIQTIGITKHQRKISSRVLAIKSQKNYFGPEPVFKCHII